MSHLLHRHQENSPRPQETHGDLSEGQWVTKLSISLGAVITSDRARCESEKNDILSDKLIPSLHLLLEERVY